MTNEERTPEREGEQAADQAATDAEAAEARAEAAEEEAASVNGDSCGQIIQRTSAEAREQLAVEEVILGLERGLMALGGVESGMRRRFREARDALVSGVR